MYSYTSAQWEALRTAAALAVHHLIDVDGYSRQDIAQTLHTTQRTIDHVANQRPTKTRILWALIDMVPETVAAGVRPHLPTRQAGPDTVTAEALAERKALRTRAQAAARAIRQRERLTQHQLADRLGISQSTVCFVESMNSRVSEQTLKEIIELAGPEPGKGPQQPAE